MENEMNSRLIAGANPALRLGLSNVTKFVQQLECDKCFTKRQTKIVKQTKSRFRLFRLNDEGYHCSGMIRGSGK
jgi:hypothetical protein